MSRPRRCDNLRNRQPRAKGGGGVAEGVLADMGIWVGLKGRSNQKGVSLYEGPEGVTSNYTTIWFLMCQAQPIAKFAIISW